MAALAAVPVVFYAYSAHDDRRCAKPEGRVSAPATGASAEEVVRGYLNAVQANDQATGRELSTPEFGELQRELADSSFCTWEEVRIRRIRPPEPDRYAPGGYSQAMRVWVEFEREVAKDQGGQGGYEPWSYLLVRNADSERWRVADEGR